MKEAGINVIKLSDEELKAMADKARTVTWPKLYERIPKEIMDKVTAH